MIDEITAQRILHQFRIESSIESVERLVRGTNHASVRLRVDGRDLVLKSLTPARVARVGFARAVEVELERAGFPVAPVHLSKSGSALVELEGQHYTLHAWVEGQQHAIADRGMIVAENPLFLREAGRALGELHRIAESADLTGHDAPAVTGKKLLLNQRYAERNLRRLRPRPPLLSEWHMFLLKREKTDFDRWIVQAVRDAIRHATRLRDHSMAHLIDMSDTIVIHNDINWENLIFNERHQLRAILDFDNATRAPGLVEVGAATVVLAGDEWDLVEDFVSAYEDETGRSVDRRALELAMSAKCVQSIVSSFTTHVRGQHKETEFLESWCRHLHSSMQRLNPS